MDFVKNGIIRIEIYPRYELANKAEGREADYCLVECSQSVTGKDGFVTHIKHRAEGIESSEVLEKISRVARRVKDALENAPDA